MNKLITILTATTMTLGVSQMAFSDVAPVPIKEAIDGRIDAKKQEMKENPKLPTAKAKAKEAIEEKKSSTTSQ